MQNKKENWNRVINITLKGVEGFCNFKFELNNYYTTVIFDPTYISLF